MNRSLDLPPEETMGDLLQVVELRMRMAARFFRPNGDPPSLQAEWMPYAEERILIDRYGTSYEYWIPTEM